MDAVLYHVLEISEWKFNQIQFACEFCIVNGLIAFYW